METPKPINYNPRIMDAGLICLIVLCLGIPSLLYPFGRDQGEYATIAQAALGGKVVYKDIFNVKPPMTHLMHQVALTLFGQRMVSIRILDLIWQMATSITVAVIAWRLWNQRIVGFMAGVLYAAWYFSVGFWETAQTDGFLNLPMAAGVLVYVHGMNNRSLWRWFVCGGCLGIGALFKYPIGILVPFLMILIFYADRENGLRFGLLIGLGFLTSIVLMGAYLMRQGSLYDFLWIQFSYIPGYSGQHPPGIPYWVMVGLGVVVFLFRDIVPPDIKISIGTIGLLALLGLVILLRERNLAGEGETNKKRWAVKAIGLWWFAAILHLGVQNKFYEYHKLPLLAPCALILAGLVAIRKEMFLHKLLRHIPGIALVIALFAISTRELIPGYSTLGEILMGSKTLEMYYAEPIFTSGDKSDYSVGEDIRVSKYIRAHTGENDEIFIWGFEPTVYFLSGRDFATKYIYNYPLYGMRSTEGMREDFLAELKNTQPRYIIVVKGDVLEHVTGVDQDSYQAFLEFTSLKDYVRNQYELVTVIDDFHIYHRSIR